MDLTAVLWAIASFMSGIGAVWAAWLGLKHLRTRSDAQVEELEAARKAAHEARMEAERLAAELHEERMRQ